MEDGRWKIEDYKHQASKNTKKIKKVILVIFVFLVLKIFNLPSSNFNLFRRHVRELTWK